ncbi:DUF2057 family protein [Vibrio fluvialis]|jgi:hypothetical protein|uniref:DUF2057 family protein n=2 Tax=Vibrio fluvialis TaxID=676 RepID=UPI00130216DE|nr:DUF2057 family protein [Vibrio fluvialis]EKO3536562.1 DUF2057 family protein [Vibrio fluvialis]EMC0406092.1 DUF2057 family protein [Vibrio fluvialis]MBY7763917.1 DUF2057 family protein [Vibrio fluvialis]MBY7772529.1 DUF2057 family protein [Vibrio fluvialis]MBY7779395.1 DUF2057 family protein [Vibrio fluvialis]
MNFIVKSLLAALVSLSTQAFASSTLVVPEDVQMLAVNMAKPEFKKGSDTQIELPDGTNQIVFKYQPQFEIKDNIKVAYSDVIIAKFESNNDTLNFQLPKFKSFREAQKEISPLTWTLVKQDGADVDLYEDVLVSNGVQIGRNYVEESKDYNIAGGAAAVVVSYVTVNQFQQPVNQQNVKAIVHSTNPNDSQMVDLLKTMYMKASPSERAAFEKWVDEQK